MNAPDPVNEPQTVQEPLTEIDRAITTLELAMKGSPLARLEAWRMKHKNRSVSVTIDDGYGAACWEVELIAGKEAVLVSEASIMEPGQDWPGLAATIIAALEHAEGKL
jgi:hypothetical protein